LTDRIAAERLDLDNIGAKVGEKPRTKGRRHEVPDLEHAEAGQRPHWSRYCFRTSFADHRILHCARLSSHFFIVGRGRQIFT
jgi:hypothetical protein